MRSWSATSRHRRWRTNCSRSLMRRDTVVRRRKSQFLSYQRNGDIGPQHPVRDRTSRNGATVILTSAAGVPALAYRTAAVQINPGIDVMGTSELTASKQHLYSITSSAVACNLSGTVRPSALAVLR